MRIALVYIPANYGIWVIQVCKCLYSLEKVFKRDLGLPYDSHSNLLLLLSDSLPICDLICLRWVNFLQKCVSSDSSVANCISLHGIFYGRSFSPIGRNTLFCCKRYNVTLFDFIHIDTNYITRWYNNTLNDELISRVSMLAEVMFIRDGSYMLPGFDLQESELRTYINYLSRSGWQIHIVLIYYSLIYLFIYVH